jgi:enoyl-[acyl-carrier-protein] reductase (NADH)
MTDDQIDDLKQFIATTVRSEVSYQITDQTKELKSEFGELKSEFGELKNAVTRVEQKVDELEIVVNTIADATGTQFNDHELRISKLEAAQLAA